MQWERLNQKDFKKALIKSKRVCVIPVGVLEKHGSHAAIGTDLLAVRAIACAAAKIEPVVVFPEYYFSQIYEARHQIGTIAIKPELLLKLLENVCDEIARNGFLKIILLNGHGGNRHFLPFFCQTLLSQKKSYMVYLADMGFDRQKELKEIMDSDEDMHAGEIESSLMAFLDESLFKREYVPSKPSLSLNRMKDLNSNIYTAIWWYSMFPMHYGGDARSASSQKGKKFFEFFTNHVVQVFRSVKKNKTGPLLLKEFYSKTNLGGLI